MSRLKYLIASGIFVCLTLIKFLFPGAGDAMREARDKYLGQSFDYVEAISYISAFRDALFSQPGAESAPVSSVQENSSRSPYAAPLKLPTIKRLQTRLLPSYGASAAVSVSPAASGQALPTVTYAPDDIVGGGEAASASPVPAQPDAGSIPEAASDESAGEALPEAVEVFLRAQEPYSDYAVPANVTYSLMALPFTYSVPVSGVFSSGFGYRLHPILGEVKFHYGTDLAANTGENVLAFADGTVIFAGENDSYGKYLTISHADGWQTLYAHCSSLHVKSGDTVKRGDVVACVGATGQATGPHLHFELTLNGVYVNPEYYVNYI